MHLKIFLSLSLVTLFQVMGFRISEVSYEYCLEVGRSKCNTFNVSYYKNFTLKESEYIQLKVINIFKYEKYNKYNCSEVNTTYGICFIQYRPFIDGTNATLIFTLHGLNFTTALLRQEISTKFAVEGFKILEVNYEHWKKARKNQCDNFNVSYFKNFTLRESEYIQLTVDNAGFNNKFHQLSVFNCTDVNSTFGICITKDEPVVTDIYTTVKFILRGLNYTNLLLLQEIDTSFTRRRGPLDVHVRKLTMNEVDIVFEFPGKRFCGLYSLAYISEIFYASGNATITDEPKVIKYRGNDRVSCGYHYPTKVCFIYFKNLLPDTQYIYKSRYTNNKNPPYHWSQWSNTLNFTTNSTLPSNSSISFRCELKDKVIKVSWESSETTADIRSLYFRLYFGSKVYTIKAQHDPNHTYHYNIDTLATSRVFIKSCSNSGCEKRETSDESCVIEPDDSKNMEYLWFFLLLIPIFLALIIWSLIAQGILSCKKDEKLQQRDNAHLLHRLPVDKRVKADEHRI